jgi:hypothetical protein
VRLRERERRPCEPGERSPEDDGAIPVERDRDAHRVRRRGVFARRAQVEAETGAAESPPDDRHEHVARVDEHVLVEEDLADSGNVAQERDLRVLEGDLRRNADDRPSEDRSKPGARNGDPEARDDLVRAHRDREEGVDARDQRPRTERRSYARHERARGVHGEEAGDGANQHHSLDPEVDDAGSLGHDLTERSEEERRPGRDCSRQKRD